MKLGQCSTILLTGPTKGGNLEKADFMNSPPHATFPSRARVIHGKRYGNAPCYSSNAEMVE